MITDKRNTQYTSTLGEVPIGTVVYPTAGPWIGEACLVAFEETAERMLLVNLGSGEASEAGMDDPCTAFPGATLVVAGAS